MADMCASTGGKKNLLQFIGFSLVGISNTLISEGIYALLILMKVHYLPASFIGFSLSVVNAYFWNSRFVFKEDENEEKRVWWKTFCKTYMAYLSGYLLSAGLLIFWIDLMKIQRWMTVPAEFFQGYGWEVLDAETLGSLLAAFINLVITVPINFIVNKVWAYKG